MIPREWRLSTVGSSCSIRNNLRFPINQETRSEMHGPYPYFGPTGILGYINEYRIDGEFALIGEDGDHFLKFKEKEMTIYYKGKANVNNHAHIIGTSDKCLAKWFYYQFMFKDIVQFLSRQGVGRYKLTKAGLEALPILLPSIQEQDKIISVISTWDRSVELVEKLLENSKAQRKALLQRLLMGVIRFPEFVKTNLQFQAKYGPLPKDWRFISIGEIAEEISTRNSQAENLPVLSCSKYDGFVDSLTYFKKKVFSDDTSNYKVVECGDFGFPSNHIEEGSIGCQNICEKGIVSPIYTVFRTGPEIDAGYLYKVLKTEHYRQIFAANTNASVDRRGSLRWKEFSAIKVPVPSLEEQKRISAVIDQADLEIANYKNQLANLQTQKKALMQQLLTGKRRVRVEAP